MKNVSRLLNVCLFLLVMVSFIVPASAAIKLKDADWLAFSRATFISSVTDIAGNPGLSITYNCPASGSDLIWIYPGNKDYSASGTTMEVEIENAGASAITLQPFVQDGSGWGWRSAWMEIPAGEKRLGTITLVEPALVQKIGIQCMTAGVQTLNIVGPRDSEPAWPTVSKYECENCWIVPGDNSPQIGSSTLASNNGYVWTNWTGTDRGLAIMAIDAPVAGTFNMLVRYRVAGASTDTRGDKFQVNDDPASGDIMYPGTNTASGGEGWGDMMVNGITLKQGRNDLKIVTSWGGIYYDYVQFAFAPEPKPTNPNPKDGTWVRVDVPALPDGNLLSWTNHSKAYSQTGQDVTCEMYIGTAEPNTLLPDFGMTKYTGLFNEKKVQLEANKHYYWMVYATEPNLPSAPVLRKGHLWQFDTLSRIPKARYEAEDAIIVKEETAPELRTDAAASGGKAVWTNWGGGWKVRGYFIFDVMAPAAGKYNLTMHYKADSRNDFLLINGAESEYKVPGSGGVFADFVQIVTLKAGANTIAIRCGWGGITYDYFELNFDDFTATSPNPVMNQVVIVNGNTLSWKKHSLDDPANAADVKCNVYLGTTVPNTSGDYGIPKVASLTSDTTIPVTLQWNNQYFWIVDSIVPVEGVEKLYKGYVWKFTTVDPVPVITVGSPRTVLLSYGNTPSAPILLKPTVTDLGKPGLTYGWSLTSGPGGETIDGICSDKTALNPQFVFDTVGTYNIKLSVTDGSNNVGTATVVVNVLAYYRTLKLEAEDAVILPGTDTQAEVRMAAGASENRIMWSSWVNGNRGGFKLTFDSPVAGNYDLTIRYFTGHGGMSWEDLVVNGGTAISVPINPTPGNVFDYLTVKNVALVLGQNTLQLNTGWGGTSYDYFEFQSIKAGVAPYMPTPENWSTVLTNSTTALSWKIDPNIPGSTVTGNVVYFGTQDPNFSLPNYGLTKIVVGTPMTTPMPVTLVKDTTYSWVVETTTSDAPGKIFRGKTWHFMTKAPCEFWALPGDLDVDCDVDVDDLALLVSSWLAADNGSDLTNFSIMSANWSICVDPVTGQLGLCQ